MLNIWAQDIVDTVTDGLIVLDHELAIVSANRAFYTVFATHPDATLGRRIHDLGDGQWNSPDLRRLLEEVLPEQSVVEGFEVDHMFPGVGRRIVEVNARKVWREGNHVESILVTFRDVTAAREDRIAAVRASEIMHTIVDTTRDPLVILDEDLRITTASRNFVLMFGDAAKDIVGLRIDELKQGQWDVRALRTLLERVVPDASPFDGFLVEDDFPVLGHRVFKLNARKIHVPGNHVTNLLLAFEDVTDAVEADRHKDMLAAELAHRIKNSLQVISTFVAFEIRRAAEPCVEGYRAMQGRIEAIAQLYDVIAKSSALGPVDARSYLHGIAETMRDSLLGEASSIAITVEAEELDILPDNAVPIGLLVNELTTNAVKYAFPQGRGRIVLGFRRYDGEVVLTVQDDGVGFDGSALSGKPSSGMGTRFIDAFVRQVGGSLARASDGTGTTVTVRLPPTVLA